MILPALKLELDGMKQTVFQNLNQYTKELNESISVVLNELMETEKIKELIEASLKKEIEEAIKEQIVEFLTYGEGSTILEHKISESFNKILNIK